MSSRPIFALSCACVALLLAADVRAQDAYEAAYIRVSEAMQARHERETEEQRRRCEAGIAPGRAARVQAAAASGNMGVIRSAQQACAQDLDTMNARHLAEWMDLEEAYRNRRPLPDGEQPTEDREEDPSDRRQLEEDIQAERDRLEAFLRSRDMFGTNRSLEADIADAYARIHRAEQALIEHLGVHAPDEVDAYVDQVIERMQRPMRAMETVGQRPRGAQPPAQRPTTPQLPEYDGRQGTNPDHVFTDVTGRRWVSPNPMRNPSPPTRPRTPPLQTYPGD